MEHASPAHRRDTLIAADHPPGTSQSGNRCLPDRAIASPRQPGVSACTEPAIPRSWLRTPLLLIIALLMMESTGVDRAVSQWFFDADARVFPWRHTFLLETVLHHWTKYAVVLTTAITGAILAFTFVVPALHQQRRQLLFLVLAMTMAPLTVTAMKQLTDRPCPWDMIEFGGSEPYTHLFEAREPHHGRGLCFPAGHASTGFALLAFFFSAHRLQRRTPARAALLAGMLAGTALGIGRIAQGAHFVSHVLWSGVVCWLVMVGLYALLMQRRPSAPACAEEAQ